MHHSSISSESVNEIGYIYKDRNMGFKMLSEYQNVFKKYFYLYKGNFGTMPFWHVFFSNPPISLKLQQDPSKV